MPATFTVETGSAAANSNAYLSVADADQLNLDLVASSAWVAATTAAKEQAIRIATAYIDKKYGARWKGLKVAVNSQALHWPRAYVVGYDGEQRSSTIIPKELKEATYTIALAALTSADLMPAQTNPGLLTGERTKVGELEVEKTYAFGKSNETKYPAVDRVLSPLIETGGTVSRA